MKENLVENYLEYIHEDDGPGAMAKMVNTATGASAVLGNTAAGYMSAASLVLGLLNMATMIYKSNFSKIGQKCGSFEGHDKSLCQLKYKVQLTTEYINKIQSTAGKCKGNPKCIEKVNKKLIPIKEKLAGEQAQLKAAIGFGHGKY